MLLSRARFRFIRFGKCKRYLGYKKKCKFVTGFLTKKCILFSGRDKVLISFNAKKVSDKHKSWLKKVEKNIGLKELNPQPYWGFDDLSNKAGTKLLNCFYVQAESKKENGKEFYNYTKVLMLQKFNFEGFLKALEKGNILVDFDARTGHNHGTKFRMRQNCLPDLYEKVTVIV